MKPLKNSVPILFFTLLVLCPVSLSGQVVITQSKSEPYTVEQMMVVTAVVYDAQIIATILEENSIPVSPDSIDYLQIIDVTDNGFGDDDVVVVYPWRQVYNFRATGNLKLMMDQWKIDTENRIVTKNVDPRHFEQLQTNDSTRMAKNWMLASILRGVNNNYSDIPMKIYFERTKDGTINFNTWGYSKKKDAIKWRKPPFMPGEPIKNYDVFRVHRVDSVTKYISNTTLYDQIYIYHQTKDTVYIATDSSKRVAKDMIAPDFQPGLIPPTGPEQNSPDTKQRKSDSTRTDQTKMKLLLEDVDSPDDTSATEQ